MKCKSICIWHVGGDGSSFGPVESILNLKGIKKSLYVFEARDSNSETIFKSKRFKDCEITLINMGIAPFSGSAELKIGKDKLSSSLLDSSYLSKDDNPGFTRWGGNIFIMANGAKKVDALKNKLLRF